MANPFGMYIIVEPDLSNAAIDRVIAHTEKTQPRDVLVMSGGQPDRVMQVAERIRIVAAKTRITYRRYPNDGAIKLFGYNGASLYAAHVKPLVSWLREHNIAAHLDNESVEDDMHRYSDATAAAIYLADADEIGLATASFATGNIPENKYDQLDSMWRALAVSPKCFWGPHEYFNTTPQGSGGHIARFLNAWKYCDSKGIKRPDTCIQEYGLLVNYDPEAGYRRTNWGGKRYGDESVGYYDRWYKEHRVSVCPFAFCGMDKDNQWRDCSTDDSDYLQVIENYKFDIPSVVIYSPIITFTPDDPRWLPAIAQTTVLSPSEIKAEPFVLNRTLDTLTLGVKHNVAYIPVDRMTDQEKVYSHDGSHRWYPIKMGTVIGWIRSDWLTLTAPTLPPQTPPIPDPPAPPVVVLPPPTNTIVLPRDYAAKRLATVNERIAAVRAEIERRQAELAGLEDEKTILDMGLSQLAA